MSQKHKTIFKSTRCQSGFKLPAAALIGRFHNNDSNVTSALGYMLLHRPRWFEGVLHSNSDYNTDITQT